jgi:hypothetical protein
MPLQATSGAASYDAFGGGVPVVPTYIEDVFSTYLYTGNDSTQTITNGIDLAGKGGLTWIKVRDYADSHRLFDTNRGVTKYLTSNGTFAETTNADSVTAFNSNGFSLGNFAGTNGTAFGSKYTSWTFRKQPKFFDVVTYTGNGTSNRQIAHNLGSVPGCIIIKRTNASGSNWKVNHRSLAANQDLSLNLTNAADSANDFWDNTRPTSTNFTVGSLTAVNGNGDEFVAYLFAHDAGGFGLTGTDNVISCGTFEANNGEVINLGYEPQWLLYKDVSSTNNWRIADTMRGLTNLSGTNAQTIKQLMPNLSNAESDNSGPVLTSTGFTWNQSGGGNVHIYIAIRRGPMKVPTSGTSVFTPSLANAGTSISVGFPSDVWIGNNRDGDGSGNNHIFATRLQGQAWLRSPTTAAESAASGTIFWDLQNSFKNNQFGGSRAEYLLARASGFMDVVCYTGNGATQTLTHNLGVAPELMIAKKRSIDGTSNWAVYAAPLANADAYLFLNDTAAVATSSVLWNSTAPTSTVFSLGASTNINQSGQTAVAYLFATCAGVSKVGSYTGTGTTLQVNCGFTGGSRFVLIKRTDSTGDWYVWDSARGIVSGNDPYLLLNTTAAEVTSTDYIDTYSAGFEITSTAPAAINASGGTFIFLAIA